MIYCTDELDRARVSFIVALRACCRTRVHSFDPALERTSASHTRTFFRALLIPLRAQRLPAEATIETVYDQGKLVGSLDVEGNERI